MSIREAAEVFGLGRDKLRQMVKDDPTLPVLEVGDRVKINTDLFREWINEKTKNKEAIWCRIALLNKYIASMLSKYQIR